MVSQELGIKMIPKNAVQINVNCKAQARFKVIKRKRNGLGKEEIVGMTGWTDNIVLDQGLNFLASQNANLLNYIVVGSGNSTPVESQTTLQNKIASTSITSPTQPANTINFSTAPFYIAARRSFRFNEGQAVGILSELGLSFNGTLLTNRALIRDNVGNIATITVLADEILDILVEFRVYLPSTFSGSFVLKDKMGNTVKTVNYTGRPFFPSANPTSVGFYLSKIMIQNSYSNFRTYSGTLVAGYTSYPNGTVGTNNGTGSSEDNSYPNARTLTYTAKFGATSANFDHKSISMLVTGLLSGTGLFGFQLEFDTVITKTSNDTLQYVLSITWDRYVA